MRHCNIGCSNRVSFAIMSTTTTHPAVAADRISMPSGPTVATGAIAAIAIYLNAMVSWRQSALFIVGAAAGLVLYHAASASHRPGACSSATGVKRACARRSGESRVARSQPL